jgi:hypothetical protein
MSILRVSCRFPPSAKEEDDAGKNMPDNHASNNHVAFLAY